MRLCGCNVTTLTIILIKANDLINFRGLDTLMGSKYRAESYEKLSQYPMSIVSSESESTRKKEKKKRKKQNVPTKQRLIYMHFGVVCTRQ